MKVTANENVYEAFQSFRSFICLIVLTQGDLTCIISKIFCMGRAQVNLFKINLTELLKAKPSAR